MPRSKRLIKFSQAGTHTPVTIQNKTGAARAHTPAARPVTVRPGSRPRRAPLPERHVSGHSVRAFLSGGFAQRGTEMVPVVRVAVLHARGCGVRGWLAQLPRSTAGSFQFGAVETLAV